MFGSTCGGAITIEFDRRGLLPIGVHPCDEDTFSELLVDRFPSTSTRPAIRDGFFDLRRRAVAHGLCATQWVGGSYVSTKTNPGDVDVVTLAQADHLNALSDDAQLFVREILSRPHGALAFKTDSYLVAVVDAGHPAYGAFEQARRYWRDLLGHTRPLPSPAGGAVRFAKGILRMGLGDLDHQPTVPEEAGENAV